MACEEFRDSMLDALYGEAGGGARAWEIHQQQCAPCGEEMRALRRLRRELGAWRVPAPPRAGVALRRAGAWMPVAAGIALGIAGSFAMVGAQKRIDGLSAALHTQEQSHRAEIEALKAAVGARPASAEPALDEVRRLIRESEARQAVVLDASLRGLAERSDAQRREDMAQVSAGFSYLEGRTGLQVARTTELMGHVLQASQKK
jgi:hypothetical protein